MKNEEICKPQCLFFTSHLCLLRKCKERHGIKMESVIKEITAIRHGAPLMPDRSNSNRYCVITYEEDGTRTAYCFGVPVYSDKTGKLVKLSFEEKGSIFYTYGSSATVTADKGGKQCDKNHILGMRFPNSFSADSADKNPGTVTLETVWGIAVCFFRKILSKNTAGE